MPTSAQAGFFDQLFGAPPPVTQPTYEDVRPSAPDGFAPAPLERRPAKRVVVDEKPVLQKTTDLMHDKTLRPGDAVMMKSGMHVYVGREVAAHTRRDFAPLDATSQIKPAQRIALAALDGTRNDPLTKPNTPDTLASGRSAAVGSPIVAGVQFTDQRGRTIRYVGP